VLIGSSLTMALAVDAAQKNNRKKLTVCLAITILCAFGFMVIKYFEYSAKLTHHTIVASEMDTATKKPVVYVYDGHLVEKGDKQYKLEGARARVEQSAESPFDIHWMSEHGVAELAKQQASPAVAAIKDIPGGGEAKEEVKAEATSAGHDVKHSHGEVWTIEKSKIAQDITYGPWKNIFFASYFTLTGIHGLHVVGGIVALGILLIQSLRGKVFAAHTEYVGLYWHFVDLVWIFLFPLLYLI
jgi:cytochrome c oxidase subunit 3